MVLDIKQVGRQLAGEAIGHPTTAQILRPLSRTGLVPRSFWRHLPHHGSLVVDPLKCATFTWDPGYDDPIARELYWRGFHGPEGASLIPFAARSPGQLVVDIGANTGLWTLMAIAAGARHVISFEPVPETAEQLRHNLAINGWTGRCTVRQEAVGSRPGLAPMFVPIDPFPLTASLDSTDLRGTVPYTIEVRVVTLDDVLREAPGLVKIDVEQCEQEVLAGMSRILRQDRPTIVFECNPAGHNNEVGAILESAGYDTYHLLAAGPRATAAIAPDLTGTYRNYLGLPR